MDESEYEVKKSELEMKLQELIIDSDPIFKKLDNNNATLTFSERQKLQSIITKNSEQIDMLYDDYERLVIEYNGS